MNIKSNSANELLPPNVLRKIGNSLNFTNASSFRLASPNVANAVNASRIKQAYTVRREQLSSILSKYVDNFYMIQLFYKSGETNVECSITNDPSGNRNHSLRKVSSYSVSTHARTSAYESESMGKTSRNRANKENILKEYLNTFYNYIERGDRERVFDDINLLEQDHSDERIQTKLLEIVAWYPKPKTELGSLRQDLVASGFVHESLSGGKLSQRRKT
jgi:hypothetical protein